MSVVNVYRKIESSLWAITITEPVPEAFELPASEFFLANQRKAAAGAGDSDVFLHDLVFLIDRHSCVARSTGKVLELMLTKPEKLQAVTRLINVPKQ